MTISKLAPREKILAAIAALAAVAALGYGLVLEPIANRRAFLNEQIEAKKRILQKDARILPGFEALEARHAELLAGGGTAETQQGRLAAILSNIESVANRSPVEIIHVKPQPPRIAGGYGEITLEVTAEGGIRQLSRFIYELEHSRNSLFVKRLTISTRTANVQSLQCTLLLSKSFVATA